MMVDHVANEQFYVMFLQLSQSLQINHLKWVIWPKVTRPMNTSKQGLFNYLNHSRVIIWHC
jgi:hypothetical protein